MNAAPLPRPSLHHVRELLSQLYLRADIDAHLPGIARSLAASEHTIERIERILTDEVDLVCRDNLASPLCVRDAFDHHWLASRIGALDPSSPPSVEERREALRSGRWRTTRRLLLAYRHQWHTAGNRVLLDVGIDWLGSDADGGPATDLGVPMVGGHYLIDVTGAGHMSDGPCRVLWAPPDSRADGWADSPEEILVSRVVEGSATTVVKWKRAKLHVEHVELLSDAMAIAPVDAGFLFPRNADGNEWRRARTCVSVALVDRYIYLTANIAEYEYDVLEAILERSSDGLVLLFHAVSNPGGSDGELVRYALSAEETALFAELIDSAK